MATQANTSDLAARQSARMAMKSGRPVAAKSAERPLLWGVQAQADATVAHVPAIRTAMYVTLQDGSQAFAGYLSEVGGLAVSGKTKCAA